MVVSQWQGWCGVLYEVDTIVLPLMDDNAAVYS